MLQEIVLEAPVMLDDEIQNKIDGFRRSLHKELTDTFGKVGEGITYENQASWTLYKGMKYEQHLQGTFMCCELKDVFKMIIHLKDGDSIGIHYLEVEEQGKGIGSEIMNIILDLCDDMKFNVDLFATAFNTKYADVPVQQLTKHMIKHQEKANQRLRGWYNSFGFKSDLFKPFMMKYLVPQK